MTGRTPHRQFVILASQVFSRDTRCTVIGKWAMTAARVFARQVREIPELLLRYGQDNLFDSTKFKQRFPEFKVV